MVASDADPLSSTEPKADLAALVDRVPEGWTRVEFAGNRYGLVRSTHGDGRSLSIFAEQQGGTDVVSANVYRTSAGDVLRPCEMPAETVLAFLRGWRSLSTTHDVP